MEKRHMTGATELSLLRESFHSHVDPSVTSYSADQLRGMLDAVIDNATLYDANNNYVDPSKTLYGREIDGFRPTLGKVPNPEHTALKQSMKAKLLEQDFGQLTLGQRDCIAATYDAAVRHKDTAVYLSESPAADSCYDYENKILTVGLENAHRTPQDLFFHESGHLATDRAGIPLERSDHFAQMTLRDELRQILREPTVTTPEEALRRLDLTYGKEAAIATGAPTNDLLSRIPFPEDFTATHKIALMHKLASDMPDVTPEEMLSDQRYTQAVAGARQLVENGGEATMKTGKEQSGEQRDSVHGNGQQRETARGSAGIEFVDCATVEPHATDVGAKRPAGRTRRPGNHL